MRIDTINKIIYIANPKTGSTSLRMMMDTYKDKELHKKLEKNGDYSDHYNFKRWKKILLKYNINIDEYFVFTTIRNPFERVVSLYKYFKFDIEGRPFYDKSYTGYSEKYTWEKYFDYNDYRFFSNFIDYKNDNYSSIIKIEDLDIDSLNKKIFYHSGVSEYFSKVLHTNRTIKKPKIYFHKQYMIDKISKIFSDDIKFGNYEIIKLNEL